MLKPFLSANLRFRNAFKGRGVIRIPFKLKSLKQYALMCPETYLPVEEE